MFTIEQQEDLRYLNDPSRWPQWPIMPMKRYGPKGNMPECGSIIAVKGYLTTIVIDDGELLWGDKGKGKTYREILAMFPTVKFKSAEAILEAGWECD